MTRMLRHSTPASAGNNQQPRGSLGTFGGEDSSVASVTTLVIGPGPRGTLSLIPGPSSAVAECLKNFQEAAKGVVKAAGATWENNKIDEIPLMDIIQGSPDLLPIRRKGEVVIPLALVQLESLTLERIKSKKKVEKSEEDDKKKSKWSHKLMAKVTLSSELDAAIGWAFAHMKGIQFGETPALNLGRLANRPSAEPLFETLRKKLSDLSEHESARITGRLADLEYRYLEKGEIQRMRFVGVQHVAAWAKEENVDKMLQKWAEYDTRLTQCHEKHLTGYINETMVQKVDSAYRRDELSATELRAPRPEAGDAAGVIMIPNADGPIRDDEVPGRDIHSGRQDALTGANAEPITPVSSRSAQRTQQRQNENRVQSLPTVLDELEESPVYPIRRVPGEGALGTVRQRITVLELKFLAIQCAIQFLASVARDSTQLEEGERPPNFDDSFSHRLGDGMIEYRVNKNLRKYVTKLLEDPRVEELAQAGTDTANEDPGGSGSDTEMDSAHANSHVNDRSQERVNHTN